MDDEEYLTGDLSKYITAYDTGLSRAEREQDREDKDKNKKNLPSQLSDENKEVNEKDTKGADKKADSKDEKLGGKTEETKKEGAQKEEITDKTKDEDKDEDKKDKDKSEKDVNEDEEEMRIKFNPEKHVLLDEANKGKKKKHKPGDEIITKLESKTEFGRIAAQTAKQVIIQRLREVEREAIFKEFKKLEGEIISGIIQRVEGKTIFIDLGRTNGVLPAIEQVFSDNYRIGQRLKAIILRVEETNRGPSIFLSRSHPRLVTKLFEFEVPEIEAGTVEIKSIAREAGSRSKVSVVSNEDNIDPIGSLVGQKGVRVQTVINELNGEKIDIIEWKEDINKYISNSLAPAKILDVVIVSEKNKHALVEVADDQFSLAIGKKGQNVRLAAKLTGWKIDVRSPKEKVSSEEADKDTDKTAGQRIKDSESAEITDSGGELGSGDDVGNIETKSSDKKDKTEKKDKKELKDKKEKKKNESKKKVEKKQDEPQKDKKVGDVGAEGETKEEK